jgi:hypothetical protein
MTNEAEMPKMNWIYLRGSRRMFWDRDSESRFNNRGLNIYPELGQWCQDNDCEVTHNYIDIPDEGTAILFLLRWS